MFRKLEVSSYPAFWKLSVCCSQAEIKMNLKVALDVSTTLGYSYSQGFSPISKTTTELRISTLDREGVSYSIKDVLKQFSADCHFKVIKHIQFQALNLKFTILDDLKKSRAMFSIQEILQQ